MKKIPAGRRVIFSIPACGVNAMLGQRQIHLAGGRYVSTESDVIRFLVGYPGVEVQSIGDIEPEPDRAGLFGLAPEQPKVITGLSGGGAMNAKPKGTN